MSRCFFRVSMATILILLTTTLTAYANPIIPVISSPNFRTLALFLIPVIAVEAFVLAVTIRQPWFKCLWRSAVANVISTPLGFVLFGTAYPTVTVLEYSTGFEGLPTSLEDARVVGPFLSRPWGSVAAVVIVSFAVGFLIEGVVLWLSWPRLPSRLVAVGTLLANVATYAFLVPLFAMLPNLFVVYEILSPLQH